jgi:hypothetical protein
MSPMPSVVAQASRPAPTHSQPAHSQAAESTPLWTSPRLIGLDAASQLKQLAAPTARAGSQPNGSGGTAPGAPFGPPCNNAAGAAAGSAGGPSSGAWAALGVSPVTCRPSPELRTQRLSPALWRPMAFVSLQERPG